MDMPEMKTRNFFLLYEYANHGSYCKKNGVLSMNSLNLLKYAYKKSHIFCTFGTVVLILGFNTLK